jgi:aspartyl-tRNA(Asn)/glutamyl-tRNA(Gln) amidotransferase subunit C
MEITKDTVKYVANLSRMELTAEEMEILAVQLKDILNFIGKLEKLDVTNVAPTSHILSLNNVLREDLAKSSLPIEQALKNAPAALGSFFGVPKVIE